MSDFKLTQPHEVSVDNPVEGDLHLGPNRGVVLITGPAEVAQHLRSYLQSFKGEWFLDENHGVPYFQDIFGKGRSVSQVDQILKRHALSVPGVREIVSWASKLLRNRTLDIKAVVRLQDGTLLPVDAQVP